MDALKSFLAISTLILFVAIAIFGLHSSTILDKDGNMSKCPLMNEKSSICRMNIFEHISIWQSMFAATTPMVILWLFVFTLLLSDPSFESFDDTHFLKKNFLYYRRQNFTSQLFNYLHLAFRKGIIHSKIFSFVTISH